MEHLTTKLQAYGKSHVYPYHMPGHKRRPFGMLGEELCGIDITEIEGFDNLHQPQGILQQLQRQAARLYGAEESFYLVNGSTAGILSAVRAALPAYLDGPELSQIRLSRGLSQKPYGFLSDAAGACGI